MTTLGPTKTRALKFRGMLLGEAAMEKPGPGQEVGREKDSRLSCSVQGSCSGRELVGKPEAEPGWMRAEHGPGCWHEVRRKWQG